MDYIIDDIKMIKSEDGVYFRINLHNVETRKETEGKITLEDESFKVVSLIDDLSVGSSINSTAIDTFSIHNNSVIERYTIDNDKIESIEDIEMYTNDELRHLFTLYTEFKMYENFMREILSEKDVMLLKNEEDILKEDEDIDSSKRILS